jgi:hypothetical protein
MADIDFGVGSNTPTGDVFSGAIVKLKGRLSPLEGAAPPGGNVLRLGQQDGNYAYYANSDYSRDFARRGDFRTADPANTNSTYYNVKQTPGGIGGYDQNGVINSYPPQADFYRFILPFYWAQTGVYTVAYPAGMSCSVGLFLADTYSLGPEYAISATTVGRKLTVTKNFQNNGNIVFRGVPTARTATTMGFRPKITYDADQNPSLIANAPIVASFKAVNARIFRMMDARLINDDISVRTPSNVQNFFGMTVPVAVDLCNQAGSDLWINHWLLQNDASVRADYDHIAANLKAGLNVYPELSNEFWNTQFLQTEESTIQGIGAGFCEATSSAAAVPINDIIRLGGNFTSPQRVPTRDFAINDLVSGNLNGSGVCLWKALQPIAANDANAALPASTNAYWQKVYNASQTTTARLRWCSQRTAQIAAIAKAAFNAVGRSTDGILPVFAWQAVASVQAAALDFDDNYRVIKRWATAPYWGEGVGGINMGSYRSGHFGTWTATEKALYLTDTAACLDAFYANANVAIDAAVDAQVSRKKELAAYLASKGAPADSIQIAAYEFHSHVRMNSDNGWSDGAKAGALRDALFNDPRSGAAVARFLNRYRELVGGDACWYGRMGLPAPWNTQLDEMDRTSPQMAAVIANS